VTMTVLETERLVLRELEDSDAEFVLGLLNEPSFLDNIGDKGVRTLEDAREYIRTGPRASYDELGFGLNLVELKPTRTPIGICGLLQRDVLPDPDIGFALLPAYWSEGYAFESASAVLSQASDVLSLPRVLAIVSPGNDASIRLLGKLGLGFDGLEPVFEGSEPVCVYSIRLLERSRAVDTPPVHRTDA